MLVHLLRMALPETYTQIKLLYFRTENDFPEVVEFVHEVTRLYGFELYETEEGIKSGLVTFLSKVQQLCLRC